MIWGYTSLTEKPYIWKSREGKDIVALKGEHARLVVGVLGTKEKPIGFYVHDPFNKQRYQFWSTDDLMKHMLAVPGVTDQAIVIR